MITNAIITAYCACALCCGNGPKPTASGTWPVAGVTVAAPRTVPFGTRVWIEGVGVRIVQDRLSVRYEGRWDVFMPSHQAAKKFGKRRVRVEVLK